MRLVDIQKIRLTNRSAKGVEYLLRPRNFMTLQSFNSLKKYDYKNKTNFIGVRQSETVPCRCFSTSSYFNNINNPLLPIPEESGSEERNEKHEWREVFFKSAEMAGITFASVVVLGIAGVGYHRYYQEHVVNKMSDAFEAAEHGNGLTADNEEEFDEIEEDWISRPQQDLIDDIISGKTVGQYYLFIGEKGTGKTSVIKRGMLKHKNYNCCILEAHADPEIFRIRLGRALNFSFFEDYIGSLFSIRGPRDTTALLDIERAFNKLEEVAAQKVQKTGKPLVLIINNAHYIRNDEEGQDLIELLQQKAESLSGSKLVTIIFNSDDYWLYERLRKMATRLEVVNFYDFSRKQAIQVLQRSRRYWFHDPKFRLTDRQANEVYDLIGGRPQHLAKVSKQEDVILACHRVIEKEKTWLLNKAALLGTNMDDDVMESGKFSTSAMLLVKELVDMDNKSNAPLSRFYASKNNDKLFDHKLPELPLWRARQIMTRPDYIQVYDDLNIFTINSDSKVKADSVPMMRAFHEIAAMPGFNELLDETCDRVSAIESLGRTRELVAKDLIQGGTYEIGKKLSGSELQMKLTNMPEDEDVELVDMEEWETNKHRKDRLNSSK